MGVNMRGKHIEKKKKASLGMFEGIALLGSKVTSLNRRLKKKDTGDGNKLQV